MAVTDGSSTSFHWRIEQGELVTLRIPVLDADGDPFVVTNWTVDAKIKTEPGGEILYTFPNDDITIIGSDVELEVPAAVSTAWTFRRGFYRIKVTHPSDPLQVHRILQGQVTLSLD